MPGLPGFSKLKLVGVAIAVALCLPLSSWSLPKAHRSIKPDALKPSWRRESPELWSPNLSILAQRSSRVSTDDLVGELLKQSDSAELQLEYNLMSRDYEWREKANIVDLKAKSDQNSRMRDLSRKLLGKVRNNQRDKSLKKARKIVTQDEDLKNPVTVALMVAAITAGKPLQASLGEDTQLRAFSNLAHGTNYLELSSGLTSGSVTMNLGGNGWGGMVDGPPEWVVRDERYRLSLSQGLPLWGLGTGVAYGTSTSSLSASLSKQLTAHLVAEVGSRLPVDESSTLRGSEESVKVKYEVKF